MMENSGKSSRYMCVCVCVCVRGMRIAPKQIKGLVLGSLLTPPSWYSGV